MNRIRQALKYAATRLYEFRVTIKEFLSCGKLGSDAYRSFYENSLLVEVHSVEKGLGLRNTQPGHSSRQVINLLNKLFEYMNRGYDISDFAFQETFRVITAYMEYQSLFDTGNFPEFDTITGKYNSLCDKIGAAFIEKNKKEFHAGVCVLNKQELLSGRNFDFEKFISTRHSVRMYEKKALEISDIEKAVAAANKAPSACNRQPNYVFFCNDQSKVSEIDSLITGSNGFKGEIPNYIIVTTDRAGFMGEEQFQWYINGGIYLSYLTLSLHSLGIGSCIMQWKAFYKTENELKKLADIPKQHAIIAIIGCGYYQDDTKCICAQRKDVQETLHIV
ncbi:MAG: nitroreductase family protein [Lachnospiraceae bacterium]|nr:nitroreductase family protein [Lachnospiraceae bacterium]